MEKLHPDEKEALKTVASQPPLQQPPLEPLPFEVYLKIISNLPESLIHPKPVRFSGKHWRL